MIDKTEFVKKELEKKKGQWTAIAYMSGVGRRTISNLMNEGKSPNTSTIEKLYDCLKGIKKGRKA